MKVLPILLILGLSGCATVPDSVKVALAKEGEAIAAVEADYRVSVNAYHSELVRQIDGRLDDIFRYEVQRIETSGNELTAADVLKLEKARKESRADLMDQADKARKAYLSSQNMEILKTLHAKVSQFAESDRFTATDFATVLSGIDGELAKIKDRSKPKGEASSASGASTGSTEGIGK